MSKYFIDYEIYSCGQKQPPTKVMLYNLSESSDGKYMIAYDEDGNEYHLSKDKILDDEIE